MIVAGGGTGTPKLLLGLKDLLPEEDLSAVVNTAEDLWISGNLVSPDLDTVLYTLAGIVDEERWWGMRDDSFVTHDLLEALGRPEMLSLGDRDRAVHIFRSELLRQGLTLSAATERLAAALGVRQRVVPMTDDAVSTMIRTPEGEMHFQEFWVCRRGQPQVMAVRFSGIERARPSPGFIDLLDREEVVVLGPSNPVTSIGPILALPGVRERLKDKLVVAVSPLVYDRPVSGPAARFMQACGVPTSDEGVRMLLGDPDIFVVDRRSSYTGECIRLDTLMRDEEDSIRLARGLLELISCS
ncbi:MAG: 2-phospho-L-lactate transferase [Methanothrix sp.]|nr:2-phospho-L-lactate transferase [Methanothrix sp.]